MPDNIEKYKKYKVLTAGVVSLIVSMGLARFAYTPILPLMQEQAGLGLAEGGWLASVNYVGYFCGVLLSASIRSMRVKDGCFRIGLIIALASSVGMALSDNFWIWALMRFLAGLSSAAALMMGSGLVLNWLIRHHFQSELGIHFSGVGLGIALCAIAVELLTPSFDWSQQTLILTVLATPLALLALAWLPRPGNITTTTTGEALSDQPPSAIFLKVFFFAYVCAGVGYVISATFIVAIVNQAQPSSSAGNFAFILIGLAATPACIIWDVIARSLGNLNTLCVVFVLQTVSILLPLFNQGLFVTYLSALLYGLTFIGIVSLVLTMAGRFYPSRPANMMGKMTIGYSIAQIAAPAITGLIASPESGYIPGLSLAGGFMVVGTMLLVYLRATDHTTSAETPARIT